MPKLPSISPEELAKALEKDGFVLKRVKGSHHTYYHPRKDRVTVIPFHSKDVPKKAPMHDTQGSGYKQGGATETVMKIEAVNKILALISSNAISDRRLRN